ncbi:hypothetical protein BC332_23394 [Capsicum chinense]|nr:hypothetical protein BC332_23394 [Capsicum chinense]
MGLNSEQNNGWEVYARKPKNKESSARKQWSPQNPNPKTWGNQNTKAWGHPDVVPKLASTTISPALKNGWDWSARAVSAHPKDTSPVADDDKAIEHDGEDNELDFLDESDDNLHSDDFDSYMAEMSYEMRKKN